MFGWNIEKDLNDICNGTLTVERKEYRKEETVGELLERAKNVKFSDRDDIYRDKK